MYGIHGTPILPVASKHCCPVKIQGHVNWIIILYLPGSYAVQYASTLLYKMKRSDQNVFPL